jgi:UDP-N-acetylenolpyruvoylglucosamine reductase
MAALLDQLSRLATVEENYPLSQATTFKIGGPARYFLAVADPENLPEIFTIFKSQ